MRLLMFILVCLSVALPSYGVIFKCTKPDGSIYYQDKDCKDPDQQAVLNCYHKVPTTTELKQIKRVLAQQKKSILQKQRQQQRSRKAEAKKAAADQKRRLRSKAKCEKVLRQINEVHETYRRGYTLKQDVVLKRKLAEYHEQRLRYCNYE